MRETIHFYPPLHEADDNTITFKDLMTTRNYMNKKPIKFGVFLRANGDWK